MSQTLLTVFGATGGQGGSVIEAVLRHPTLSQRYKLRGVTRDTSKPAAQALQKKGVEVVQADLNDVESLEHAVRGSHAVFSVTNYWDTAVKEDELRQGTAVVDACCKEHVHHLIWSSLPHVTKMTDGQLANVEHFDSKAEVEEYIRAIPTSKLAVATFFMPAFFMQNIKGMIRPSPQDGVPTFAQPWDLEKTHVPLLDSKVDTGNYVAGILAAPEEEMHHRNIQGTSDWQTPKSIVEALTAEAGSEVRFLEVTKDQVVAALGGGKVGLELAENMLLVRDFKYFGLDSEEKTAKDHAILPQKPVTWEKYVKSNGPWTWAKQ